MIATRRITPIPIISANNKDSTTTNTTRDALIKSVKLSNDLFTYTYDSINDILYVFKGCQEDGPYVCVKRSDIPSSGYGLFACRSFKKGFRLGSYVGRIVEGIKGSLSDKLIEFIYTLPCLDDYSLEDTGFKYYCDGGNPPQNPVAQMEALGLQHLKQLFVHPFDEKEWPGIHAHIINDPSGPVILPGASCNCKFRSDSAVILIKDVEAGEEFYVDYNWGPEV